MVKGYEHFGFVSNYTGTGILQYKYEELSRF